MKKSETKSFILLVLGVVLSGLILLISSDNQVYLHVLSMLVLTFFSILSVKGDFWHPFFWFTLFFFLYSSSYSITYLLTGIAAKGYYKEVTIMQWLAEVVFIITVGTKKVSYDIQKHEKENYKNKQNIVITICEFILIVSLLYASVLAMMGGYTSKSQMYSSGNLIINLASRGALLLNIIYIYHQIKFYSINNKINKKLIFFVGVSEILFSLCTGERDRMIIFAIETIYFLYYIGKVSKKHFILFIPTIIIILPLLTMFKYKIMTGNINDAIHINSVKELTTSFFSDEFYTVGRNLTMIYNNNSFSKSYFNGKSIINDFLRVFIKTNEQYNNNVWFSKYITKTKGYGFTIVGEGYINYGFYGIALVMLLFGLIVKMLYHNSYKNKYYLIIYIYMIPIFIYSIRADLANVLSPLIVHTTVAMLLIIINDKIKYNKKERIVGGKYEVFKKN